jgi:alkylhydroperoxidase/carboxymuconolactone decarboxylase family protein YurZ
VNEEERRRRGRAAYASQFRVPEAEAEEALAKIVGPRMAAEAVLAAGGAWHEDDPLTLRERSLVATAILAAQGGAERRLAGHVRWAFDHGATTEELESVGGLVALYAGYARASIAMEVVRAEEARRQPPSAGR